MAMMFAIIAGCVPLPSRSDENTLVIFHNGTGPMCLEALNWLDMKQAEQPGLLIEEHLTTDAAGFALLEELTSQYGQSQGLSAAFGYLPVIFFRGQAFSGFDDGVAQSLAGLISSIGASP